MSERKENPAVVVAQIGARDHYAFARAFHREGMLEALITDYWHRGLPGLPAGIADKLKGRRHPELADAVVYAPNLRMLGFELEQRFLKCGAWPLIMKRNRVFQKMACGKLSSLFSVPCPLFPVPCLFSYSYAAGDLFRWAKQRGWKTVLGQIDPGPPELRRVGQLEQAMPGFPSHRGGPPAGYYDAWREELELADRIVVNSEWSRDAMLSEGVDPAKLVVVPIPYEPEHAPTARSYPKTFSTARPLRLLFLGQVNLRKGAAELLEAMVSLTDEPVELSIVGVTHFELPETVRNLKSLKWHGKVAHHDTERLFQEADLFVLPTHSDGFGLAQVEALAHGLPVLTSPFCARVVEDGTNGRVLPEVSVQAIVNAIRGILDDPRQLARWSANCKVPDVCRMENVSAQLRELVRGM